MGSALHPGSPRPRWCFAPGARLVPAPTTALEHWARPTSPSLRALVASGRLRCSCRGTPCVRGSPLNPSGRVIGMAMDVDSTSLQRLLDLQTEDSAIDRLEHQRASLPEAARLAE